MNKMDLSCLDNAARTNGKIADAGLSFFEAFPAYRNLLIICDNSHNFFSLNNYILTQIYVAIV